MTEVLLPPWIIPEEETHEWLDEGSSVFQAAFAPGLTQRQSYGGLRLKLSRRHTVRAEEKAQLLSTLYATRGRYNLLRTKVHFALRGSGFGTELLSNNTFASGTTGWTAGSQYTVSVADRALRMQRNSVTASQNAARQTTAMPVAQYAPYVARAMLTAGRGAFSQIGIAIGSADGLSDYGFTIGSERLASLVFVPRSASAYFSLLDNVASGPLAGDYFHCPYVSTARCALVDNGSNALLRSDELNTGWTLSAATIGTNETNAPDGTATADAIEETTANAAHFITQDVTVGAAAADFAFSCALKSNGRQWGYLRMSEGTGGTQLYQTFDLNNGLLGSTNSTGANWSNLRAFISPLGNGWYYCSIVARKTNAATTLTAWIGPSSGDNVNSYVGTAGSGIRGWRATLAQSSVPTRLVQTTSAAASGTTQTGGALYLKGLPASSAGLLLPGDWHEIGGELKHATAVLNSDSSGLGYLQFEPPLVRSPADNDPVIIADPMGRLLVSNIRIDNEFGLQAKVSYDLEHIYE